MWHLCGHEEVTKVAQLPWEYFVRDGDSSSVFLVGASF